MCLCVLHDYVADGYAHVCCMLTCVACLCVGHTYVCYMLMYRKRDAVLNRSKVMDMCVYIYIMCVCVCVCVCACVRASACVWGLHAPGTGNSTPCLIGPGDVYGVPCK
jgi:hypothetical protein